jgi:hypothetical protein
MVQRPRLTHVALSLVQATVNHCCATMSENETKVSADLSTIAQIGEVFWIIGLNDSLKSASRPTTCLPSACVAYMTVLWRDTIR